MCIGVKCIEAQTGNDSLKIKAMSILPQKVIINILSYLPKDELQEIPSVNRVLQNVVVKNTWFNEFDLISTFIKSMNSVIEKIEKDNNTEILSALDRDFIILHSKSYIEGIRMFNIISMGYVEIRSDETINNFTNLLEVKSLILQLREGIIEILTTLKTKNLLNLEILLKDEQKPIFFEHVFALAKIYQRINKAYEIDDTKVRDETIWGISKELIEIDDFEVAIELVNEINDDWSRETAFSDIAKALANVYKFAMARDLIKNIQTDRIKNNTLKYISAMVIA